MIRKVSIKDIHPNPFQTRKSQDTESIKSLADEINRVGLWAGALRGRDNNGHVELCFGHRRLDAVKLLGWKQVDVDVVQLTDEEMSLQGMIENLQREGLNDADKGEGIARYLELRLGKSQFNFRKSDDAKVMSELVIALGLGKSRIHDLLDVSRLEEEFKKPIRQREISGVAALAADRIGGPEAIATAAKKKMSFQTVAAIGAQFTALPDVTDQDKKLKENVRQQFVQGAIDNPEDVVAKARQIRGQMTRKEAIPPDLINVIRDWTERAIVWAKQLDEVIPVIDYIDTQPAAANRWRAAVSALIAKLEKFV